MDEKDLQNLLKTRIHQTLLPLFDKYNRDFSDLESLLKWKPIVLLIGNYSSGKSTLINELAGEDIQRTGQAPTDDSFTIITHEGADKAGEEIPGSSLVNDETLPFTNLKGLGEQLISHLHMKKVATPLLTDMAIIDSPGMLDSVTEKDRGYNYMAVIAHLAKLADLVVLMFDPLKAGTIKETYTAIRDTLPENAGEDRLVFVMSRIDECDSTSDLVRSYGTLCWNLSQMTGRKDIPHIFLTCSPDSPRPGLDITPWSQERDQLKNKILTAPKFRVFHILQDIDRQVNELQLTCEAMANFSSQVRTKLLDIAKLGSVATILAFFFSGLLSKLIFGFPEQSMLEALLQGEMSFVHLTFPLAGVTFVVMGFWIWLTRITFPRLLSQRLANPRSLVTLESDYRRHLWEKVEKHVLGLLRSAGLGQIFAAHNRNLNKIKKFLRKDLKEFYEKIR
ncbi:MAG: dynamin family protein [Proteobacteria bacterium]|nr:dynamin family protein [Pseudomonadota bacterium]MBU1640417.1 dynamin family protein [Pseudomonadota bacterium]